MSNNRKRNMRKLARNIITGTALAVGGLTQTSANETQVETQTNNSGGLNAATGASLGLSAVIGAATIGAGYLQYRGNQELTKQGQEESARHNQKMEATETKKQEREEVEMKAGISYNQARTVCNNLKVLAIDNGGKNEASPEEVMNLVRKGGSGAKILQKLAEYDGGAHPFDEAAKLAVTKLMKEALISKNGGKALAAKVQKLKQLFKDHASQVKDQTIVWTFGDANGHAEATAVVLQDGDTGDLDAGAGSHFLTDAGANAATVSVAIYGGTKNKTKYNRLFGNVLTEDAGKVFENCFQANLVQPEVYKTSGKVFKGNAVPGGHGASRADVVKSFMGTTAAEKLACAVGREVAGKGESSIDICIGTKTCLGPHAGGTWNAGDNVVTLGIPRIEEWNGSDTTAIRKALGEGLMDGFSYKDTEDEDADKDKGMFD